LWIGDRLLNDLPPHKRDMAFVFQSYALYPHRTVADNMAFPLQMAGMARQEIRRRVGEAAELLGLSALLDQYPRQLSGGERQRVAVGRAIVRQPSLFLFDEPLSNLDAPLRAQMRKELKQLHQRLGTTFIYVTHDQEEALSLSDRIAILRDGRIQQCGDPDELYYAPANMFVASFFGMPPINVVAGTLQRDGKLSVFGQLLCVSKREPDVVPAGALQVGIRPEDLAVRSSAGDGAWPARVALVEMHGSQCYMEVEVAGQSLTAVTATREAHQVNASVWVTPRRLHLFNAETGERLATIEPC
jgi:multiple sugar transport system ATP-binding protein